MHTLSMRPRDLRLLWAAIAVWTAGAVWAASASGQLALQVEAGSSTTARAAAKLGLVPMRTSTSVATGEANVAALNAWTTGGGWRDGRGRLDLVGERYALAGAEPWDMGLLEGLAIAGTGLSDVRVESQFGSQAGAQFNVGGQPSGFVWVDADNLSGPMLKYRGMGWNLGDLNLQGAAGSGLLDNFKADLVARRTAGTLKEAALLVEGQQTEVGVGVGKLRFSAHIIGFMTGIKTVATPLEDNADETRIYCLRTPYCQTGIHFGNKQSLGWRIDYYDHNLCPTAILLERGGDLSIGQLVAQNEAAVGVKITGNSDNGATSANVTIDHMQVDAQAPDNYLVAQTTNTTAMSINIGYLRGEPNRAPIAPATVIAPYFDLGGNEWGELNIHGGEGLFEGLVGGGNGSAGFPQTVRVENCRFMVGADLATPRELFSGTYRGYVNVEIIGCREGHGSTGSANAGTFYRPFCGRINVTGPGAGDYTLVSGGYLDEPDTLHGTMALGNPAPSTTYRGVGGDTGFSSAAEHPVRSVIVPRSGRITAAYFQSHAFGTQASATGGTLSVRVNEASNTTITSAFDASGANNNTSLSIPVAEGDRISWQLDTPAWGTAPTSVYATWSLKLE
ncbi:MAG: hypothetical protein IT424_11210 [Pirellulales bacterium]|nr:hypothetical protein [Pirellulales bacterium]